ncbi:lysylphosphatidylglycerol synthase transmembrane domain-containing protein [Actinobaculum sp. 313]|uniref:lysylphosphatidylglycerol synthase transmembrane domain-containing protein n=1 Tax=Actinobaculum sp. 313 TaxID=2495645 RepID=UPI000D5289D0|nr:lysylphosphatidylglycerol synthase transmembrane domain-containing protein [Actinobaculum sp. 313]AWE43224.1 lysylphosphatidylglycerol synthetase family protein [Actinobaculum sp. 313]
MTNDVTISAAATPPRRSVVLVDEVTHWLRRPRDLVSVVLYLISIGLVMLLAVYGASTTLAVTRDVRTATSGILQTILFMPINVLEGLLSFFLPLAVAVDLAWRRRWRSLVTSAMALVSATALAYGLLWLFQRYFPLSPITGQLSDSISEQTIIFLLPYVAAISAVLTVNGSRKRTKIISWGWWLLIIVLIVSVLQGTQTLPGALITVLLGMLCGCLARYIAGDDPDRVVGADLVNLVRRAGIDAVQIVRIDDLPDDVDLSAWRANTAEPIGYVDRFGIEQIRLLLRDSTAGEAANHSSADTELPTCCATTVDNEGSPVDQIPPSGGAGDASVIAPPEDTSSGSLTVADDLNAWQLRAVTIDAHHPPLGEEASRNYIVTDVTGRHFHLALLDADQHIVGLLATMWNRIVLTTSTRRSERTIEASTDRVVLMELTAANMGVCPQRLVRVAGSDTSMAVAFEVDGATAFSALHADTIPDSALDEVWDVLQRAHRRGLSHGDIRAGVVALRDGHAEILHWENGSLAASEITRRIDMAQAMAMLATTVGFDRAIASAKRCLPVDQIVSLAPILQAAILPNETRSALTDKRELQRLRDAMTVAIPAAAETQPMQLRRFSARTVITVSVGLIAVFILLGSINFEDLKKTLVQAQPLWILLGIIASGLTYLGAGITLKAFTAEHLTLGRTTMVQLAASVVSLVAPAGIGHATLNLRFLQRQKVPIAIAVATVSLVQVAQFVTTILLLILLGLLTDQVGSLSIPSGTILLVLGIVVAVIVAIWLIPPLRRWLLERIRPTLDKVWPRLVWLATHPRRIFYGFFGCVVQTVGYVAAFGACLAAFNETLSIVTLAVTYLVSNSIGSVVPSPGGIGPVEAALTGGLTLAGVPYSVALSTAVLYRLLTFWGPVPIGWLALRRLTKKDVV